MTKNFEEEKKWLLEEKYKGKKNKNFFDDCKKLEKDFPLAFLIGNQPFFNCIIDLEFFPLIPRPETEFWVSEFVKKELENKKGKKILDIFSGSGCIGISVLKNTEKNFVDFSEKNKKFIKQIKKNLKINKIEKNFDIFCSDVFEKIPEKKYDYILANSPYIPENKKIDFSVENFEDKNSLFAKDDGLFFVKKIITEGKKFLKKDGKIYIEFDETSKKNIEKFLIEKKIKKYFFQKDQYKNWRFLEISF